MDAAALDALLGDTAAEREESWRYSRNALRALTQGAFAASAADAAPEPALLARADWEATRGRRVVFVNGVASARWSDTSALGEAVQVAHDGTQARIVLRDGAKGALHLVYLSQPGATATLWQGALTLEAQSGATDVIENHLAGYSPLPLAGEVGAQSAPGEGGARRSLDVLGVLRCEYRIAPGARLRLLALSDLDASASLIRRQHTHIAAGAALDATIALFGGRLQRTDLRVELAETGARCRLRGAFVPSAREHVDVQLDIRHAARDTASDVLWRGVADGRGRGILRGAITVAAGADGADAQLATKNLLLSPHAEIDAQPVLEIHADEVKAAHGATVGQLDDRALFYLRSRGVPAALARQLLIAGFCREALDTAAPEFVASLEALLAARLPQTGAEA